MDPPHFVFSFFFHLATGTAQNGLSINIALGHLIPPFLAFSGPNFFLATLPALDDLIYVSRRGSAITAPGGGEKLWSRGSMPASTLALRNRLSSSLSCFRLLLAKKVLTDPEHILTVRRRSDRSSHERFYDCRWQPFFGNLKSLGVLFGSFA
jgi:hypothetical protein